MFRTIIWFRFRNFISQVHLTILSHILSQNFFSNFFSQLQYNFCIIYCVFSRKHFCICILYPEKIHNDTNYNKQLGIKNFGQHLKNHDRVDIIILKLLFVSSKGIWFCLQWLRDAYQHWKTNLISYILNFLEYDEKMRK